MPTPMMADVKRAYDADVGQPIRCAVVVKPTEAQRYKKEMLRYVVVAIALLAVLLLIAIAGTVAAASALLLRKVPTLKGETSMSISEPVALTPGA